MRADAASPMSRARQMSRIAVKIAHNVSVVP
jgi:hypothetical protein